MSLNMNMNTTSIQSVPKSYESLWLDDQNRQQSLNVKKLANKVLQNEKFQSKVFKLIQHFDNDSLNCSDNASIRSSKSIKTTPISNPISFAHISHVDSKSNFGLEKSFQNINPQTLDYYLPETSEKTTTPTEPSTPIPYQHNIIFEKQQQQQQPFSSYRTSPSLNTPLRSPISHSNSNKNLRRSSSIGSNLLASSQLSRNSTFTTTNNRLSCASSNSTVTTNSYSRNNSIKMNILPIIPQEDIKSSNINFFDGFDFLNDIDIDDNKFNSIPSAPPIPLTLNKSPNLKKKNKPKFSNPFMKTKDLEIASDSEDDDIKLEKFKLPVPLESITDEIQSQLYKRLSLNLDNKNARTTMLQFIRAEYQNDAFKEEDEYEDEEKEDDFSLTAQKDLETLLSRSMSDIIDDFNTALSIEEAEVEAETVETVEKKDSEIELQYSGCMEYSFDNDDILGVDYFDDSDDSDLESIHQLTQSLLNNSFLKLNASFDDETSLNFLEEPTTPIFTVDNNDINDTTNAVTTTTTTTNKSETIPDFFSDLDINETTLLDGSSHDILDLSI